MKLVFTVTAFSVILIWTLASKVDIALICLVAAFLIAGRKSTGSAARSGGNRAGRPTVPADKPGASGGGTRRQKYPE